MTSGPSGAADGSEGSVRPGIGQMSADELAERLGTAEEPYLLDVREADEVAAWSIPGVAHLPLGELAARLGDVPADREVVVVCASGNRSMQAAALLAAEGRAVWNLAGGMNAWGQVYDTANVEVSGGRIVQVRRRGKGCLSYVIGAGGEAFVIDPSMHLDQYLSIAARSGWRISRVFDTHLHADHVSGARELARHTGASLHLSPHDTFDFGYAPLSHDERFALPDGLAITVSVFHTPGHTEGSVVFTVGGEAVLTGDTLFVDGVGRPDLAERAEEFASNLHRSLHETVLGLPGHLQILPAHYGSATRVVPERPVATTLGELRTSVPALSLDETSFVVWAATEVKERPPNYVEIVRINMGRRDLVGFETLEAGPNRCSI